MASIGHVAVGLLAARILRPELPLRERVGTMAVFGGLALLPDFDYFGVALGIANVGPCGHRGATHSLVPVLLVGLLAAWMAPRYGLPRLKTALLAAAVVGSHGLLDAMTMSGRGVPTLWPFNFRRFTLPWRPIPDAPCGLAYLSLTGLRVAAIEVVQFLPLLVLALRPTPRTAPSVDPAIAPVEPADSRLRPPMQRAIR
jgi:inner membrane protein